MLIFIYWKFDAFFFGCQDSRIYRSLGSSSFVKIFFFISTLRLIGFPFSLGFFSKDLILSELSFSNISLFSFIFFLRCCVTISYSMRIIYLSFFNFSKSFSFFFFKEEVLFFLPVMGIYLLGVYSGNFFSYYFFSISFFSLLDLLIGLILIFFFFFLF